MDPLAHILFCSENVQSLLLEKTAGVVVNLPCKTPASHVGPAPLLLAFPAVAHPEI